MTQAEPLLAESRYIENNLSGQRWWTRIVLWCVLVMAHLLHFGQTRRSGDRYIEHSMAVADLVRKAGLGVAAQAAALLHDVVEERKSWAKVWAVLVVLMMGPVVAFMVFALTNWRDEKKSYFRQIVWTSRLLELIAVIKMADKLTCVLQPLHRDRERELAFLGELHSGGAFANMVEECRAHMHKHAEAYNKLWSLIQSKVHTRLHELESED